MAGNCHGLDLKFPTFSGEMSDYFEFRDQFWDLVDYFKLPGSIQLAVLKEKLPQDLRGEISGCNDVHLAWEMLEDRFADPDLVSVYVKNKLLDLIILEGKDYEQMLLLCSEVRLSENLVSNCGLNFEFISEIIATLMSKLPEHKR